LRIDADRNQATAGDRELTAPGATVRSLVVSAREDLEIARQVRSVLE
jgi:acetate kinase